MVATVSYVFIALGVLALAAILFAFYYQARRQEDDPALIRLLWSYAEGCCISGCIGCCFRAMVVCAAIAIAVYALIALC